MIAFVKYRNIVNDRTGPISKVTSWVEEHPELGSYHDAVAYLDEKLCPPKSTELYAHGVGGGASKDKITSVHKAISEALERWAYYDRLDGSSSERTLAGLNIDPTTTGFACHPSLFLRTVRKKADSEAVERWSVFNWWKGNLPSKLIERSVSKIRFEIITPFKYSKVIVCAEKSSSGKYIYGFSAASNELICLRQALVEQNRNRFVLDNVNTEFRPVHLSDRRLVYFSTESGFQNFLDTFERSSRINSLPDTPRKIIDNEIFGPWSKYARVWRVLYEGGESWHSLSEEENFIF